jgi:hypothetical protein
MKFKTSRIDNPLAHLQPDRLEKSAREFAIRINRDEPDFRFWCKAAQVARYQQIPHFCDSGRIRGMTALEKKAIREQKELGFWQQPRPLRVTIVTLCLAAVIQGWVQTGLVSPIISIFFQYEEARCFLSCPARNCFCAP